jgi:hypothetical protein
MGKENETGIYLTTRPNKAKPIMIADKNVFNLLCLTTYYSTAGVNLLLSKSFGIPAGKGCRWNSFKV